MVRTITLNDAALQGVGVTPVREWIAEHERLIGPVWSHTMRDYGWPEVKSSLTWGHIKELKIASSWCDETLGRNNFALVGRSYFFTTAEEATVFALMMSEILNPSD